MKLGLSTAPSKKLVKAVPIYTDENGMLDYKPEALPEDARPVVTLQVEYTPPQVVQELIEKSAKRQMVNTKTRAKSTMADWRASQVALAQHALRGWDLTVRGCHALRCVGLDYEDLRAKGKFDEKIDFDPQSVSDMAKHSALGALVNAVISDFDFWFPGEKEELGNSVPGPASSTVGSAAPAA